MSQYKEHLAPPPFKLCSVVPRLFYVSLPWLLYGNGTVLPNTLRDPPLFIRIDRPFTITVTRSTQLHRPLHRVFFVKTENELSKSFANTY